MTTASIAQWALGACFAAALLFDGLWRLWRSLRPHRFATRVTVAEWRVLMRDVTADLKPPVRLCDGDPDWVAPEKRQSASEPPEAVPNEEKVQRIDRARGRK
jgi:hypothetical protein